MNPLQEDLTNKVVLVKCEVLKDGVTERRFLCLNGNGCHTFTLGTALIGRFLDEKETTRIDSNMIESLCDPQPQL